MTDQIPAWLYAALRAAIQSLVPSFGGTLALLDRDAVVTVLVAVAGSAIVGGVVGAIRWLETRTGDSLPARAARFAARVLMLGASKYQPVYAQASSTTVPQAVALVRADNVPTSIRGVPTVAPVLPEQ